MIASLVQSVRELAQREDNVGTRALALAERWKKLVRSAGVQEQEAGEDDQEANIMKQERMTRSRTGEEAGYTD